MSKKNNISDDRLDKMLKNYCRRKPSYAFNAVVEEKKPKVKPFYKYAVACACAVALICGGVFAVKNSYMGQPEGNLTGSTRENHSSTGFLITAYAAEKEGDSLSENFSEDLVPTVLKPDIEVMLSNYNLFMSSVPGLPLTVSKDEEDVVTLSVSCTTGAFCRWERSTGKITEEGNNLSCTSGETIYWRPALNEEHKNSSTSHKWNTRENIESVSQIEVTAVNEQNKKTGSQLVIIGKNDINYFAVLEETK